MDNTTEIRVAKKRIYELDLLKGIAFLMMVWDHAVYDLYALLGVDMSFLGFFKEGIGKICAIIFMTVCGISVTLGNHNIKRGLITFGLGMALTVGTVAADMVADLGVSIWFGILHFLGFAMIIGHFAKKLPVWVISLLAIGSYYLGEYFLSLHTSIPFLFPFGIIGEGFHSADYYPIFPNLAFVLMGIAVGKLFYKDKKSLFNSDFKVFKPILFLGRNTLILYFVHQPVVLAVLWLVDIIFIK